MAVTPDGTTLYVLGAASVNRVRTVIPVDVASGAALRPVSRASL